jgi:L-lactate dehydrogenase (cytochrome)
MRVEKLVMGYVYDVPDFVDEHLGGTNTILRHAENDTTGAFLPIHPGDTLQKFVKPN